MLVQIKEALFDFLYTIIERFYQGSVLVISEMVKLITKFPLIKETSEIYDIWLFLVYLSTTCIALIFIYLSAKNIMNIGYNYNFIRTVELKQVFTRMLYMIVFIIGSLPFIDYLILFNNTLIDALSQRFDVMNAVDMISASQGLLGNFIASALIIYQIYLVVKIMIGYWLRVAEVNLMAVVSPVMMVLWINPNWGGYLSTWLTRLVTLIFTQFTQVLILVLYAKLAHRFFTEGTIKNLCLAISFLILMTNTPVILQRFICHDNTGVVMVKTYNNVKRTISKTASLKDSLKNKLSKLKNDDNN